MQTDRSNMGALIGGAFLIAFGLLALAGQFFPALNWGFLWPLAIVGFGAFFFVLMFTGGKQMSAFAIPGSIVTGVGLILFFQNITHHWESMSYFWTLIILFIGVGIYIMGWHSGDTVQRQSGLRLIKVGAILFVIFGVFFEMIFSGFTNTLFPILLIALGAYLVLTRSGLFGTRKHDPDEQLPPTN